MTDDVKKAAEEWLRNFTLPQTFTLGDLCDQAFLAGASFMLKEVLEALRSDECMGFEIDLGLRSGDSEILSKWLKQRFKE